MSSDLYYSKYLKYKQKYLDLKKSLVGSGKGVCLMCDSCNHFRSNGTSDGNCVCTHQNKHHF